MKDLFAYKARNLSDPASSHMIIIPSDDERCAMKVRGVRAGDAGVIMIADRMGTVIPYAVAAGEVLPFRPEKILATDTTVNQIVGWW